MTVVQADIPSIKDAKVELDLSGLGTFTAGNTLSIEGEITEVAVSGGDFTTSNLPVLNGTTFTSTGEKQPYVSGYANSVMPNFWMSAPGHRGASDQADRGLLI